MTDRETERDRERERERERQTDRERDRETETETERQRDRETERAYRAIGRRIILLPLELAGEGSSPMSSESSESLPLLL
eukprot:COSAG03_NODE_15166_length_439_cov_1.061765_1_plen_78_part_10